MTSGVLKLEQVWNNDEEQKSQQSCKGDFRCAIGQWTCVVSFSVVPAKTISSGI